MKKEVSEAGLRHEMAGRCREAQWGSEDSADVSQQRPPAWTAGLPAMPPLLKAWEAW